MGKNNRKNRETKKRQQLAKEKEREARKQAAVQVPAPIARVALSIGALHWAYHRPQPWAQPHQCYTNALEMMDREGGSEVSGWTFHMRTREGVGHYVMARPHGVWHNPHDRSLVDVTPHPDPHHAPVMVDGKVLFVPDDAADPVPVADGKFLSPPLRFFAVGDSPTLAKCVTELNEEEAAKFEREKQEALARARG